MEKLLRQINVKISSKTNIKVSADKQIFVKIQQKLERAIQGKILLTFQVTPTKFKCQEAFQLILIKQQQALQLYDVLVKISMSPYLNTLPSHKNLFILSNSI